MGKKYTEEQLFDGEDRILEEAQAVIADAVTDPELLAPYTLLVSEYQKLLRTTKKAFYISDLQGKALQRQQTEMRNLLDNANQGFLTFASDLKVDRQYSVECVRVFGQKIAGLSITALLTQGDEKYKVQLEKLLSQVFSNSDALSGQLLQQFPARFRIKDRDIQVECKRIMPKAGDESLIMMVLTDITEKRLAEEKIYYLSYHDKMTGLYNRAYVEITLPEFEAPSRLPMSIIILDMNGLKLINDVFGHHEGDKLLIALARIMKECCRPSDIIARWGGDEFLVLLPETSAVLCQRICERIEAACAKTETGLIEVSAAIGRATKTRGSFRFAEMFSEAEDMMYSDKLAKRAAMRQSFIASLGGLMYRQCHETDSYKAFVEQLTADFISFLDLPLSQPQCNTLLRLGRLHDIGKAAISSAFWGRKGILPPNEWDITKNQSDVGYRLADLPGEKPLAQAILLHHEWWDGTGYPHGLKGEDIPLEVRIFSLIDMYDTLTEDYPNHPALTKGAAIAEIAKESGKYFDPALTQKFLGFIKGYMEG